MDLPIDTADYRPTRHRVSQLELTAPGITALLELLVSQSRAIKRYPYDPAHWLDRAHTLSALHYPELAYGDAWKAERCCDTLLAQHRSSKDIRLGACKGFWMYDEQFEAQQYRQRSTQGLMALLSGAVALQNANSEVIGGKRMIGFIPQSYPWLDKNHRVRKDVLLQQINNELATTQPLDSERRPYCLVRRDAHEISQATTATELADEALGVFALRTIPRGCTVIKEKSEIWGCSEPTRKKWKADLCGEERGPSPVHPNPENNNVSSDLHWVQDIEKDNTDRTLLRLRCLLQCIKDGATHPLDNPMIARLRPTYHNAERVYFPCEGDIAISNMALLRFGVDILANQNFDTWVLFTLEARLDNNCWSQPNSCCLNTLFALFNHSCEPNVTWECQGDQKTVHMSAIRDIGAGEQLFVQYNSYLSDRPLRERQKVLRRWIDGDCSCTRCRREMHSEIAAEQASISADAVWNYGVAALPEELLIL